jgi:hypothetical protein
MRSQFVFALCLALAVFTPLAAQTSPELVIEETIGSPLQGQLQWLDDERLLVGTSAETRLYEGTELIYTIPDGGNFTLIDNEIVLDGQRWDSTTGELLGETSVVKAWENEDDSLQANLLADGTVEIRSGDATFILPLPENYSFSRIIFSPDGIQAAIVFSYGDYETLQLWNLATHEKIGDLSGSSPADEISDIQFFQEGRRLVANYAAPEDYGNSYFESIVWDTENAERLNPPNQFFWTILTSPNAEYAFLISNYGHGIHVWGMNQLGQLCEQCAFPSAAFSADGQYFAAADATGLSVWELSGLEDGILPRESFHLASSTDDYSTMSQVIFHPNGELVLRWSPEIGIEVWDIATDEQIAHLTTAKAISELSFSPDGTWLRFLTNSDWRVFDTGTWNAAIYFPDASQLNPAWTKLVFWLDGDIVIDDIAPPRRQSITIIEDYHGTVIGMHPEEEWVAFDSSVTKIYSLRDKSLMHIAESLNYQLNPVDSSLISIYGDNEQSFLDQIHIENTDISTTYLRLETPSLYSQAPILMTPDGRFISQLFPACGDGGGGWHGVWDGRTGELLGSEGGGSCGPDAQILSHDGRFLITAWSSRLYALDLNAAQISDDGEFYNRFGVYWINSSLWDTTLSLSPNDQFLALNMEYCTRDEQSTCPQYRVDILHLDSSPTTPEDFAELLFSIPDASNALFSPDSQFILTNQSLWSITGAEIMSLPNQAAAFDPSGNWLVSYSDNELLLWDWTQIQTGIAEPLYRLPAEGITKLAFNADGSFLYAQRAGDVLRIRVQTPQS